MADWTKPTTADTHANRIAFYKNRDIDLALGLDPAHTAPTGLPTNAIRYTSAGRKWEIFNGTTWGDLAASYAISIDGNAGTATKWATGRTVTLTGVVTGVSVAFDGSANLSIAMTYPAGNVSALNALATTGLIARTGVGALAARTLTGPAAGISVTNGNGVAGNPTLALTNDMAALEGLASTGIAVRTAADTWAQRTITGTANRVNVTNGNGVSGNPTLDIGPDVVTLTGAQSLSNKTDTNPAQTTQTLTDAASIVWDMANGSVAKVTLAASGHVLANPTNVRAGGWGWLDIVQDATGGRTMSWGSNFKHVLGVPPTLSTAANARDRFFWSSFDGTSIDITMAKGMA